MKTKQLSELNNEELIKVYNTNDKLQYEVWERYADDVMYWIGEYLKYLKDGLKDWSLGFSNREQNITVGNFDYFVDGVEKMQSEMPLLSDDNEKDIIDIKKKIDEYKALYNDDIERSNEEWDNIDSQIEYWQDKYIDIVFGALDRQFDYTLEDLEYYFIEVMADDMNDYYIDADTLELFEDIAYTKSYR